MDCRAAILSIPLKEAYHLCGDALFIPHKRKEYALIWEEILSSLAGITKGFAFITLEDEEGLMNVVVRQDVYLAYKVIIRLEPFLLVEGIVEKKEGLINIKADKIAGIKEILCPVPQNTFVDHRFSRIRETDIT